MEKYTVVGVQAVDFTGSDGNKVEGWKVHCTYENEHVDGMAVLSQFVKSLPNGLHLGDCIQFTYNRYGKVTDVQLVN